jgi:hypothetical protein
VVIVVYKAVSLTATLSQSRRLHFNDLPDPMSKSTFTESTKSGKLALSLFAGLHKHLLSSFDRHTAQPGIFPKFLLGEWSDAGHELHSDDYVEQIMRKRKGVGLIANLPRHSKWSGHPLDNVTCNCWVIRADAHAVSEYRA